MLYEVITSLYKFHFLFPAVLSQSRPEQRVKFALQYFHCSFYLLLPFRRHKPFNFSNLSGKDQPFRNNFV